MEKKKHVGEKNTKKCKKRRKKGWNEKEDKYMLI
jgi:hypothetical protein